MKKLFKVVPEHVSWCDTNSVIVCANDEFEAVNLCKDEFNKDQGNLTVLYIDLNESRIIEIISHE